MSRERLFVCVQRTPDQERGRPAPERVRAQRAASRVALRRAAERAGCPDDAFEKTGERGKPVPTASGWHWSISHDATLVAGVVSARFPIGVDVERCELRRRVLVERVANESEREALGETADRPLIGPQFARLWTGKEAVLKAERIGIPGLSECIVTEAPEEPRTELTYRGAPRHVLFTRIEDHFVSLCSLGPERPDVVWLVD